MNACWPILYTVTSWCMSTVYNFAAQCFTLHFFILLLSLSWLGCWYWVAYQYSVLIMVLITVYNYSETYFSSGCSDVVANLFQTAKVKYTICCIRSAFESFTKKILTLDYLSWNWTRLDQLQQRWSTMKLKDCFRCATLHTVYILGYWFYHSSLIVLSKMLFVCVL